MIAYQLCVEAQNKPGSLARITATLAREKINLRSITISTFHDHGIINILVDDSKKGFKALQKEGLPVSLKPVLAVLIDDKPGGLDELIQLLYKENINVENAYGFVLESWKNAVFVLDVDQEEKTRKILHEAGFKMLSADALAAVEPFHYMKY